MSIVSKLRLLSAVLIVGLMPFAQISAAQAAKSETAEEIYQRELDELDAASDAAGDYALNNDGVGIVLHVGRDISGRSDAGAALAKVQQYFINEFAKHGVAAQVFPSSNSDALATVATFHIHDTIHGAASGTEVKSLKAALEAIPDAARQLKAAKVLLQ